MFFYSINLKHFRKALIKYCTQINGLNDKLFKYLTKPGHIVELRVKKKSNSQTLLPSD